MKQIYVEESVNKTIKHILTSLTNDKVLLKFDDDTYSILSAYHGYAEDCIVISTYDNRINLLYNFDDHELIDAGFYTREDIDEYYKQEELKRIQEKEHNDYQLYLQLKEKFES